jgi:hypothetical protein
MSNLRRIPYTKPLPPGAEIITRKGKRLAPFKDQRGTTVEAPPQQRRIADSPAVDEVGWRVQGC